MKQTVRAVGALVATVLVLAGCVRVESDIEIFSDDTVTQTLEMGFARAIFELEGGNSDDALADLVGSVDEVRGTYEAVGLDVVVEEINTDDEIGLGISYEHQPLNLVNDPRLYEDLAAPTAKIERIGDTFRVDIPASALDESFGDEEISVDQLALFMTMRSTFTFPGAIIESNGGTVEGNTITFSLEDLAAGEDLYVIANAGGSLALPIWVWIVLALLLIGATVTVVMVQTRRSKAAPFDALPPVTPSAPGTPASTASTPAATAVPASPAKKPAAKKPANTTKASNPGATE